METIINWAGLALLVVVIAVIIGVVTAYPVMLLWNAVIPGIFGLKVISFTEALYLSLLCSILFKSTGSSSSKNSRISKESRKS